LNPPMFGTPGTTGPQKEGKKGGEKEKAPRQRMKRAKNNLGRGEGKNKGGHMETKKESPEGERGSKVRKFFG